MSEILPDITSNARLARAIGALKKDADSTRTEAVTGRYEDITKVVRGDVGSVHLIQKSLDDAVAYQRNLTVAEGRLERTQAILGSIAESASGIGARTLAANALDQNGALGTLADEARSTLSGMFASLNSVFGGRAVFGGDAATVSPLGEVDTLLTDVRTIMETAATPADLDAALDTYFNDPAGGFTTSIYRGGANSAPSVEIGPGVRINASVKADDPSIRELMRGFAMIANLDVAPEADRTEIIATAGGVALNAEQKITSLRAKVGVDETRIASAKDRFEGEERVLTELMTSQVGRDPYEAATRLQLLETQLETSYLMTARLSRLSLANFL